MGFAVVRHPDVAVAGVLPEQALPVQRVNGWYRVSGFASTPADLDPPSYGPDAPDLDAPPEPVEPKTVRKPAKTTTEEDA